MHLLFMGTVALIHCCYSSGTVSFRRILCANKDAVGSLMCLRPFDGDDAMHDV